MKCEKKHDLGAIYDVVSKYYTEKINTFGPSANGVDWKDASSQVLRFAKLLELTAGDSDFSICDWGCGYGALLDYMHLRHDTVDYRYVGYDWSEKMIAEATRLHGPEILKGEPQWHCGTEYFTSVDYTVASGIFNVKLGQSTENWQEYVLNTLRKINALSRRGFAFNMLTSYSDVEKMRSDLNYASPTFYFDLCKSEFSRYVTLLHDYPLYEFTILVWKKERPGDE